MGREGFGEGRGWNEKGLRRVVWKCLGREMVLKGRRGWVGEGEQGKRLGVGSESGCVGNH